MAYFIFIYDQHTLAPLARQKNFQQNYGSYKNTLARQKKIQNNYQSYKHTLARQKNIQKNYGSYNLCTN
jgi:hypothetical protein